MVRPQNLAYHLSTFYYFIGRINKDLPGFDEMNPWYLTNKSKTQKQKQKHLKTFRSSLYHPMGKKLQSFLVAKSL